MVRWHASFPAGSLEASRPPAAFIADETLLESMVNEPYC
jgi:hypothetical protein